MGSNNSKQELDEALDEQAKRIKQEQKNFYEGREKQLKEENDKAMQKIKVKNFEKNSRTPSKC